MTSTDPTPANAVDPADEGRHAPGPEDLFNESWYFDFFDEAGAIGGWLRLGLYPNLERAWYHAFLVRPGQPLIAVSDDTVPLPRGDSLEIRGTGLWADHTCEVALDHWSVANETHAVALDDPAGMYTASPRGDIVPLALDLEWETAGTPFHYAITPRYEVPCAVHGEILVGDERLAFDGWGQRDHSWAVRDWWSFGWVWTAGRLDDGLRFHGTHVRMPQGAGGIGYLQPGDGTVESTFDVDAAETLGRSGFPTEATVRIAGLELSIQPLAFAPAFLVHDGREARFPRAMCRFTATDGRTGLGWTEWNQP